MAVWLEWDGKRSQPARMRLPLQAVETVNAPLTSSESIRLPANGTLGARAVHVGSPACGRSRCSR